MEELELPPETASPEQPSSDSSEAEAQSADAVGVEQESDVQESPEDGTDATEAAKADESAESDAEPVPEIDTEPGEAPAVSMDELLGGEIEERTLPVEDSQLKAVLEAIVYVAEEPLTLTQIAAALEQPAERIRLLLDQLIAEFDRPDHGLTIREVAGGFKMATKPEHHDAVRNFVKSLKPPLKLSLPALETLAVIAYKQPVTAPEIMEIRGVQGAGVLKTLLDRKLIVTAGRKNVIGKPILYKTTKEFLIQFGLKDLAELPSLKEFEELRRMALTDSDITPTAESEEAAEAPLFDGEAEAMATDEPEAEPEPPAEGEEAEAPPAEPSEPEAPEER